ncbi:hypothetical protein J6590_102391, partial [Homalodisca vitripennis]
MVIELVELTNNIVVVIPDVGVPQRFDFSHLDSSVSDNTDGTKKQRGLHETQDNASSNNHCPEQRMGRTLPQASGAPKSGQASCTLSMWSQRTDLAATVSSCGGHKVDLSDDATDRHLHGFETL